MSLITIDLRKVALDTNREPLVTDAKNEQQKYLSTLLSRFVLGTSRDTSIENVKRFVRWCWAIDDNLPFEVDEESFKVLYDAVAKADLAAILRGQILLALDDCKAASQKTE